MDQNSTFSAPGEPLAEDENTAPVATLDEQPAGQSMAPDWTGPRCEKCQAPMKSEMVKVCRSCGWYASLGTYLEVDPNFETEDELHQAPLPPPQPSHLEVWMNLLPWWAWAIIGTVSIVVAESVIVRQTAPAGSWLRTAWSFTQLLVGVITFLGFHLFSFLVQAADDADMNTQDLLIRPLKVWKRIFRELPTRLWLVNSAAASLTAVVMSLAVIGGLNYERLLDWGFEPPPKKQKLMGAMMSQMQKTGKSSRDNLQDAVQDFAGSQNLDQDQQPTAPPPKPREETDCVILGYRAGQDGRIHTLLLGTSRGKKLVYAGTVPPPDKQEFAGLEQQLVAARTDYPFLQLHTDATWVEPKFTCRASYTSQAKDGRLLGIRWEKYSGTISMP